ncbi:Dps family protein [Cohnella fermenti]|uniref:DNA starvation/stationary phase protection protein n=1 Tax=Cohnella fermenti TaxID=2565925 RepID=A0A4S4BWJ9_9BACL|nr:Dps family protein [Cohnella fermenti]THF79563.1 DNA starvation/stationary phase protection protein [Cohnella fermenti]
MSAMKNILTKQLANWIVIEMKLRTYHWHVRGPQFFTLHAKFEELYGEAAGHIDELAERLLALGDNAVLSLAETLRNASVQESGGKESSEQMVAAIANDFSLLIEELRVGQSYAESLGDITSADLLQDIAAGLEKHVWMLNAYLGVPAQSAIRLASSAGE